MPFSYQRLPGAYTLSGTYLSYTRVSLPPWVPLPPLARVSPGRRGFHRSPTPQEIPAYSSIRYFLPVLADNRREQGYSVFRNCRLAAILRRKYRVPSEPRSQAASGVVSTGVGDHLGTPRAASFFDFFAAISRLFAVKSLHPAPILFTPLYPLHLFSFALAIGL